MHMILLETINFSISYTYKCLKFNFMKHCVRYSAKNMLS